MGLVSLARALVTRQVARDLIGLSLAVVARSIAWSIDGIHSSVTLWKLFNSLSIQPY